MTTMIMIITFYYIMSVWVTSSNAIVVPATRLVTVGDRAFPVTGSRLWNSLPTDVTSATTSPVFLFSFKIILIFCFFPCMICVRLTLTLFSAFAVCI